MYMKCLKVPKYISKIIGIYFLGQLYSNLASFSGRKKKITILVNLHSTLSNKTNVKEISLPLVLVLKKNLGNRDSVIDRVSYNK